MLFAAKVVENVVVLVVHEMTLSRGPAGPAAGDFSTKKAAVWQQGEKIYR